MFKMRDAHLQAFSDLALEGFLERATAHVRRLFPNECASARDLDLRKWFRRCIDRAGTYGLASEYEVMCYVDTTFLLGANFDTDPNHLWALELLMDQEKAPRERAEQLIEEARKRR